MTERNKDRRDPFELDLDHIRADRDHFERQPDALAVTAETASFDGNLTVPCRARLRSRAFLPENIPLDMIFIRADGRILRIAENTEPLSTKIIPSGGLSGERES